MQLLYQVGYIQFELEFLTSKAEENEENNKSDDNGLHASACGMRQLSGYTAYR